MIRVKQIKSVNYSLTIKARADGSIRFCIVLSQLIGQNDLKLRVPTCMLLVEFQSSVCYFTCKKYLTCSYVEFGDPLLAKSLSSAAIL